MEIHAKTGNTPGETLRDLTPAYQTTHYGTQHAFMGLSLNLYHRLGRDTARIPIVVSTRVIIRKLLVRY